MSVLKTPWQRAYRSVWRREQQYLARYETRRVSPLDAKLEELAPESLLETLRAAFSKAFSTVFENGTGLIDRAGRQTQRRAACRVRQYAADQWEDRASLRAFTKAAGAAGRGNVLLSGAAGVGMGLVGAALPDVPLFTAMVLKCVYETGESFGFSHDDPSERRFILCLIETALSDGAELKERNQALNAFIQDGCWNDQPPMAVQLRATARQVSQAVLYGKILQGIPLVGVLGGAEDAVLLGRIQRYAAIKYERRFLIRRRLAQLK